MAHIKVSKSFKPVDIVTTVKRSRKAEAIGRKVVTKRR